MKFDRYLIVFLLIVLVVGLSFFMPPIYAVAVIPAVSFGAILIGKPRQVLFLYLGIMAVYPLLKASAPPILARHLDEVLGVMLYTVFFGHLAFRRIAFRDAGKYGKIALLMFGYVLLSWLINRGSPRGAVQCFFKYFSFIPCYILALKYLKKDDFKLLFIIGLVFFWVNFGLNIGWGIGVNPLPNEPASVGNFYDQAIGSLEGCNLVAYFCCMFLFLLTSVWFHFQSREEYALSRKQKVIFFFTFIALMYQLYITYTNHSYVILAVSFIPYFLVSGLWKKWQVAVLAGGALAFILIAFAVSEPLQNQFSKENLQDRKEKFSYGAKAQLFEALLVKNREAHPREWLLGVGPGNGMGPLGKDNLTPFALRMLLPVYLSSERDMRAMQMTSISGNTTSAVLTLWGDFGLVGFLIFTGFYILLFGDSLRRLALKPDDLRERIVLEFFIGALTFFVIINILIDVVGVEFLVLWLWFWAAWLNLPQLSRSDEPSDCFDVPVKNERRAVIRCAVD